MKDPPDNWLASWFPLVSSQYDPSIIEKQSKLSLRLQVSFMDLIDDFRVFGMCGALRTRFPIFRFRLSLFSTSDVSLNRFSATRGTVFRSIFFSVNDQPSECTSVNFSQFQRKLKSLIKTCYSGSILQFLFIQPKILLLKRIILRHNHCYVKYSCPCQWYPCSIWVFFWLCA